MKKNKHFWKVGLFLFLALALIFYSGHNQFLDFAHLDHAAFEQKKTIGFKPQSLPKLHYRTYSNPELSAQAYLVIDLDSFTPILAYNAQKKMYPASTVKLATALVALNNYKLDDILTVKQEVAEELKMNLVKGERISTLNLLYGILLYSANDAALTLAQNHPQGEKIFIQEMNELAKKIGLTQTHFTNPIGFDHPQQHTTATDLALLAREFIKNPILLNITSTKAITVADTSFTYFHPLYNINELLGEVPHLGGLKTGTTEKAGQNLISFYRWQNKPVLIIVMKSEDRFSDTRQLIDLLNQNLVYETIN